MKEGADDYTDFAAWIVKKKSGLSMPDQGLGFRAGLGFKGSGLA